MARRLGLKLKVPTGFPEHSLPPTRAFYWIEERVPAKAIPFAKAAYRSYWLDGRSTSDPEVVAETAASIGLDRDIIIGGMQEPAIKDRVFRENQEAIGKGVFGSPFFFDGDEPFWGSDRLDLIVWK